MSVSATLQDSGKMMWSQLAQDESYGKRGIVGMIFVTSEDLSKIERVESKKFVALDVWERRHIQQWVRSHPEILGEYLLDGSANV